jgi:23S rRNA pseudouridine1911/1915/1917 synthase
MRTLCKPAGLPVFPPHDDPSGDCLLRRLLADAPERARQDWPPGFDGGLAHRLDTSTSGAVLVADDPAELAVIRAAFSGRQLTKTYLLRTARPPAWSDNACDRAIGHDKQHRRRMVVQRGHATPHRGAWHPAETRFRALGGDLLEATMSTGVMHQIRVHAAFLGVPLLGDALYGGGRPPDDAPDGLTFFLHHVGLTGPGVATDPVPLPGWAAR